MARIRTARLIAAAASLPLAVALMGGVAQADSGANAIVNTQVGSGNQANNAGVVGGGPTWVDQDSVSINFSELW
ncbi:hypothetical protein N566_12425 [Streptomycetaceae bacterium MP113-05]|nr:hypothetical protein N566_12425 [Streptomycetaceae bacterium MP113-05]